MTGCGGEDMRPWIASSWATISSGLEIPSPISFGVPGTKVKVVPSLTRTKARPIAHPLQIPL